ncbi:hypothetical protein LJ737_00210 [Hymenobacter sp. 15J16-1T3B]|uniref:hypothetical protein n=1 Tax=Hymenobacter sp. 15J16-1T3B TaxID=2886941 RepID=UPI001D0FDDB2|nr:hypothetical protein [Hymenobacter sp. 15J16-1T3B]MCC3155639.1 hypothetical protein [Hymenobacter sp. 15J16-1T3B]
MVRLATTRLAAAEPQPGLPVCQMETYYPTTDTQVHITATTVGLALFYEAGGQIQPEQVRFAFAEGATPGRRLLTIEIEYSPEPSCLPEL